MNTTETSLLPPDVLVRLEEAARYAVSGVHDPDVMREACEDINAIREKNRRLFGEQCTGTDIVHEMRSSR